MLKKFRKWFGDFRLDQREYKRIKHILSEDAFADDRREALLVRLVHSIEKGLSIKEPRLGFGYDKIKQIFSLVQEHINAGHKEADCLLMARDVIGEYCEFHGKKQYSSEKFDEIKEFYAQLCELLPTTEQKFGGTREITRAEVTFDLDEVDRFFTTRHSVREFQKGAVDPSLLAHAIELAQCAPSACNRQAVRVYAIDSERYNKDMNINLEGIGGFADDVDQFLLICGKKAAYEDNEYKQSIVSASIFAGYLSMTLHALGIGSCIIQRSLRPSKEWDHFCELHNIPGDEHIVCMIGIGNLKEMTRVPISHRYAVKRIFRTLD